MKKPRRGSLQNELEELEGTDPKVGAAAKKYEEAIRRIVGAVPPPGLPNLPEDVRRGVLAGVPPLTVRAQSQADRRITHLEMAIFDAMASLPPGPALDTLSAAVEDVDLQALISRWEEIRGEPGGTVTVTAGRDAHERWYVDTYFGSNRNDGREAEKPLVSLEAFWERASGRIGPDNSLLEIRFAR